MASYGGANIFGAAVQIQHVPQATASQVSAFFGVSGQQSIFGGTRGRVFTVTGVLLGTSPADIRGAEALMQSYADGIARDLVDTVGATWPAVVFRGEYQPQGQMGVTIGGWAQHYRAVFHGLI